MSRKIIRRRTKRLALACLAASLHLWGAPLDPFALLADKAPAWVPQSAAFPEETYASVWQPTAEDQARGFTVGRVGLGVTPHPAWLWTDPRPLAEVEVVCARGEFRANTLAVRTLRASNGFRVQASDLHGPGGALPAACVDVRSVQYRAHMKGDRPQWKNLFLERSFPSSQPRDHTLWLWVSIMAPEDTTPGIYRGELKLMTGDGQAMAVPIRMRVLDLDFAYPAGAWGAYLPGHAARESRGIYANYATPDWNPANLERYFRYWRTRGLNSPNLFHVYPELRCLDGRAVADFPFCRAVAKAMKTAGLTGPLCIDTRHTMWWADAAGKELDRRRAAGLPVTGDLGVKGGAGRVARQYGPTALRLYAEAVRQLLQVAETEAWPPILLLAEEELSHTDKAASYDACMPTLQAVAGDRVLLVDNVVGYGRPGEIDRGHRDGVRVRQYNNWTEAALQAARTDKAEIWSYNLGWGRAPWSIYTLRTGSTGYHQWADHWVMKDNPLAWVQTLLTDDGVVTSVTAERAHEGLCDLAYYRRLETARERLSAAGHPMAAHARATLTALTKNTSVQRYEFAAWASGATDTDFALWRWRAALALRAAENALAGGSGREGAGGAAPGRPALRSIAPRRQGEVPRHDRMVHAVYAREPVRVDATADEPCWLASGNLAGPLWWTAAKERYMRAKAGSVEEFKAMNAPSYGAARIAYGQKGLYFLVTCNHSTEASARCNHADDDPDLWEDDCMEFFFQAVAPQAPTYQLIVNVKGRRVLKRDIRPVPTRAVTATTSPVNPSGGYRQEIFLPWADLDLDGPPAPGTVWRLNVCREFNSWSQLTCWSQVEQQFGLGNGMLVFDGPAGAVSLGNLELGQRGPGQNALRGTVRFRDKTKQQAIDLRLIRDDGKAAGSINVPLDQPQFEMPFHVDAASEARTWRLLANDKGGKVLCEVALPVPTATPTVRFDRIPKAAVSGQIIHLDVVAHVGDLSATKHPMRGLLRPENGDGLGLGNLAIPAAGRQRVALDTSGLRPGHWTLKLWLDGLGSERTAASQVIEILPSPFAAPEAAAGP